MLAAQTPAGDRDLIDPFDVELDGAGFLDELVRGRPAVTERQRRVPELVKPDGAAPGGGVVGDFQVSELFEDMPGTGQTAGVKLPLGGAQGEG